MKLVGAGRLRDVATRARRRIGCGAEGAIADSHRPHSSNFQSPWLTARCWKYRSRAAVQWQRHFEVELNFVSEREEAAQRGHMRLGQQTEAGAG